MGLLVRTIFLLSSLPFPYTFCDSSASFTPGDSSPYTDNTLGKHNLVPRFISASNSNEALPTSALPQNKLSDRNIPSVLTNSESSFKEISPIPIGENGREKFYENNGANVRVSSGDASEDEYGESKSHGESVASSASPEEETRAHLLGGAIRDAFTETPSNNLEIFTTETRKNAKNGRFKKDILGIVQSDCPTGHFTCDIDASLCVPQAAICNGKEECPDGSDEGDCENVHDKKFWDTFFQKRPGADVDVERNISCKYSLPTPDGGTGGNHKKNLSSTANDSFEGVRMKKNIASSPSLSQSGMNLPTTTLLSSCLCSGDKLFCQNLHFPNLNMIPRDVVFLDLSGSRVGYWNFSIQQNNMDFQKLETLILSSTALQDIHSDLFSPLKQLRFLHLPGNKMGHIPPNAFTNLENLSKLYLGYNKLSSLHPESFNGLAKLEELDLRHNKLRGKGFGSFASLTGLKILHLSYNEIETLSPGFLSGLENLEMLSLTKNKIQSIVPGTFEEMTSLNHLHLSYNQIEVVEDSTFCNLRALLNLNLNDNGISRIQPRGFECLDTLQSLLLQRNKFGELDGSETIFSNLTELQHIYFDQFWMCSWASHVRNCEPKGDGISSIDNLLDNVILRTCVWVMGLVGVVGNMFVIVSRLVLREKNRVHSFYIKNLALADLLMGIFLLSIAFHDVSFRGEFLARQHSWRHSLTCQWSGLLSTLSSEASVLILTMITLDRYLSIVRPFAERRNSMLPAAVVIIVIWTVSFLLCWVPLSGTIPNYFGRYFYSSNGLCLPLHIHNPFDSGWQYSFFLFVILNSIAFIFICYAYWQMLRIIQASTTSIRSTQQKQDGVLAKRFGLVVLTDFLCWAPVIVSKTLAMSGVQIQTDFYAWLAVFVLPVNSALNPIIYTLTTKLFKQQVAHYTVGFRKRLGLATDDSTTSSLFYRNRVSRTLNTSLNSSMMMSTKSHVRGDRTNPSQQLRNRYTVSSINSVVACSTGLQLNNGQANPVDANDISNTPKLSETAT